MLNCDSSNLVLTFAGAAGEAAFMTGLERNSDIVYALLHFFGIQIDCPLRFAASYAPLLGVSSL